METVMANRRARRVAVVAGEDRPQQGGPHRTLLRRGVAVVTQRVVRHPRIEHSAYLEELDEEGPRSERCDSRGRIPLDVDATPERIERDRPGLSDQGLAWCFTHWRTPFIPRQRRYSAPTKAITEHYSASTAVYRLIEMGVAGGEGTTHEDIGTDRQAAVSRPYRITSKSSVDVEEVR